jgi:integrase
MAPVVGRSLAVDVVAVPAGAPGLAQDVGQRCLLPNRWVLALGGLDAGRINIRGQLEQRKWEHGCAGPDRCGERAAFCPERTGRGLVLAELKTRQSRRTLPLPQPLIVVLRKDRQQQREARIRAGTMWHDSGLVFTNLTGRGVAPADHSLHRTDFLERSGVRPARLHNARHTAASLLLVQGVDQRVVMSMFGWTSPAMTTRYQHVVPELVEEANRRMGELLWGDDQQSGT